MTKTEWKPTEKIMRAMGDAIEATGDPWQLSADAFTAAIIAVQPDIAAEALDNFGVKQNRMLGVVEYTGEMAAIITRVQAEASAKALEMAAQYFDGLSYWQISVNIRQYSAMIEKEPPFEMSEESKEAERELDKHTVVAP